MEKRILLEKRGRSDDEITELILDNCRSTNIEGLTDSFTALETLSLINVGLVSLKNFPKLSNLRKLELSDNRISNGLSHLMGSPKLTHLNLSGNRIKDFDELQPLKDLKNLEVLDLFNNQVTLIENYRDKLFELIPSLIYLDGFDKDYVEAPSDEEDMADDDDFSQPQQPSQFSINGIEIDLDELEQFEAKIRQKRSKEQLGQQTTTNAIDLQQEGHLVGHIDTNPAAVAGCSSSSAQENGKDDLDLLYEEIQHKQALARANEEEEQQGRRTMVSFLSVLLMFTTLLAFINHICYRGENQLLDQAPIVEDDDEDVEEEENKADQKDEWSLSNGCVDGGNANSSAVTDDDLSVSSGFYRIHFRSMGSTSEEVEGEDSCEESDDVSLAYLYNDNLEEDQEDWKSVESDYNNADEEFDTEDEEEEDGAENNDEGEDGGDSDGEGEEEEDGEGEEEVDGADEEGNENGTEETKAAVAASETAAEAPAAEASSIKEETDDTTTEVKKLSTAEDAEVATSADGDESEAVKKGSYIYETSGEM
ncbi:uncharacterized protein LOC126560807 [Anopheles maculipalpis]|uniref:uncharacterized protein LOC126560807 n=1 Tax=Anopheles maculipalpis TaxID=1496333 RepID=UPI002158A70B|nr:uncharacterized protein LOC126560807 [Anopheles maculipalpis]